MTIRTTAAGLLALSLLTTMTGCKGQSPPEGTAPAESLATASAALACDAGDAGPEAAADASSPSPAIGTFAIYATESVLFDDGAQVTGCNVGVEGTTGPFLGGNAAAYFNSGAKIDPTQTPVPRATS